MARGGARKGAGRPALNTKEIMIRLTPSEHRKLRLLKCSAFVRQALKETELKTFQKIQLALESAEDLSDKARNIIENLIDEEVAFYETHNNPIDFNPYEDREIEDYVEALEDGDCLNQMGLTENDERFINGAHDFLYSLTHLTAKQEKYLKLLLDAEWRPLYDLNLPEERVDALNELNAAIDSIDWIVEETMSNRPMYCEVTNALACRRYDWIKEYDDEIISATIALLEPEEKAEAKIKSDLVYCFDGDKVYVMTRNDFVDSQQIKEATYTDWADGGGTLDWIDFTDKEDALQYAKQLLDEGKIDQEQYQYLLEDIEN